MWRPSIFSGESVPLPIQVKPMDRWEGRFRETTRTLFDSGNAIGPDTIEADDDGNRRSSNGGIDATPELASVERCSALRNASPKTPPRPPRSLPAWSDVQSEVAAAAHLHVECRRRPMCHGNIARPGQAGGGGGSGEGNPVWF